MEVIENAMAEREGFEPPVELDPTTVYKPLLSTTQPPLRLLQFYYSRNIFARLIRQTFSLFFQSITFCPNLAVQWVFKTGAINHSATSPELRPDQLSYIAGRDCFHKWFILRPRGFELGENGQAANAY